MALASWGLLVAPSLLPAQSLTGTNAIQTWNVQTGAVTGATAVSLPTAGTLTFSGTPGTLAVTSSGANANPAGLTFSVGGYTLLAGTTYQALTTSTVTVNSGTTALGLALAPSTSLAVNGTGTLVFSTDQTFSGTTTVAAGTLRLGSGGTTGTVAGNIVLGSFSILGGSANGTLIFNRSNDLTYAGVISTVLGTGSVEKLGAGAVTLTGVNTYSGPTTVTAGTLRLGASSGALPTATALTVASGATFDVNGRAATVASLAGAGNITLGTGTLTAGSGTFSGLVSGLGGLTKTGSGTLILTGTNTFSGNATVRDGALQIGNGGTTGTLPGNALLGAFDIGNGSSTAGRLVFNRSDDFTYSGIVSSVAFSTGSLQKLGAGVLTLTGASTFLGDTIVSDGTLRLGATSGSLPVTTALTVASGATFDVNGRTATVGSLDGTGTVTLGSGALSVGTGSFSGPLSGTGSLTKVGSGSLTLSGNNSLSGGLTLSGGTLGVSSASALGAAGSTITFDGGTLHLNSVVNPAHPLVVAAGGGTITTSGGAIGGDTITNSGGALELTNSNTLSGTGTFTIAGSVFSSLLGTTTPLRIVSGGNLILGPNDTLNSRHNYGALSIETGGSFGRSSSSVSTTRPTSSFYTSLALGGGGTLNLGLQSIAETDDAFASYLNDLLIVSGGVQITATAETPFIVRPLNAIPEILGEPVPFDFDPASARAWTFITGTSFTGYAADAFTVDLSGFNVAHDGTWAITQSGNALQLAYTPSIIPEPGTFGALAGAAALVVATLRRRRKQATRPPSRCDIQTFRS